MRAAVLCRMSTDEQGASLDDQEHAGRSYAADHGWTVDDGHVYRESASGYKPGTPRPELDRMLSDASHRAFDVLVVWRLNRLSRQKGMKSAAVIVWQLQDYGIAVHSVKEKKTGVEMIDDLFLVMAVHQGSEESRIKSEDTQRGKLRSITQRGVFHGGFAPFGYRRAGTMPAPHKPQKNIVVYDADPTRAPIIQEIFRRYLAGESPHALASDFNRRQLPAPRSSGVSANRHARRGDPIWQDATVRSLLRNPLLGGWASYKGRRVKACSCATPDRPDGWNDCDHDWTRSLNIPGIVDPQVWEKTQDEVNSRRGRVLGGRATGGSSKTFLLLGLLWCGECGERLACRKARQTNVVDRYVCQGRRLHGCTMPTIRRTLLDESVRAHFVAEHVVDTQESIRRERDRLTALRSDEAGVVRDELMTVEGDLARVRTLARRAKTEYQAGDLSAKAYSSLVDEYEHEQARCEAAQKRLRDRLTAVEGSIPVEQLDALLDAVSSARRMIAGALDERDVPRMNAKLHEVVESLTVYRRGDKLCVVPRLKGESSSTVASARSRVLDFGGDRSEGVEIGETLGQVVLRNVVLAGQPNLDPAGEAADADFSRW